MAGLDGTSAGAKRAAGKVQMCFCAVVASCVHVSDGAGLLDTGSCRIGSSSGVEHAATPALDSKVRLRCCTL